MAFADFALTVSFVREGAGFQPAGPSAEPHRPTHFVNAEEFAEFVNDAVGRLRFEFRAVRLRQSRSIAGVFNSGALHAEADSEEGDFMLAGELDGVDHTLNAALAKTTRNQNAVVAFQ